MIVKFNLNLFPTSGLLILYAIDLPIKFLEKIESFSGGPVKQVACGYNHSALVTVQGELYTWGKNNKSCTGHPIQVFTFNPSVLYVKFGNSFRSDLLIILKCIHLNYWGK